MTAWSNIGLLSAAFIVAAAAPHIGAGVAGLASGTRATQTVEQSAFSGWQQTVIPIVLSYDSAIRVDAALSNGLPSRGLHHLLAALHQSENKLADAQHRLHLSTTRQNTPGQLASLTAQLGRSVTLGELAQHTLAQAVRRALEGSRGNVRATAAGLLRAGVKQLHASQSDIYTFSLQANKLGAALSAKP
ncbi:hypothetical protein [Conexibacter sp. DBS9H8]|uniref:hypothetical protein n=1 Tax=Conexibacter sp. DBS9H8 TaxID=2937801 RepID=UPI00200C54B6|nr:hypothetical protein [Conexibacter sp. DBS9H8]